MCVRVHMCRQRRRCNRSVHPFLTLTTAATRSACARAAVSSCQGQSGPAASRQGRVRVGRLPPLPYYQPITPPHRQTRHGTARHGAHRGRGGRRWSGRGRRTPRCTAPPAAAPCPSAGPVCEMGQSNPSVSQSPSPASPTTRCNQIDHTQAVSHGARTHPGLERRVAAGVVVSSSDSAGPQVAGGALVPPVPRVVGVGAAGHAGEQQ